MTRILLTGAAGQLGRELQRTLTPLGEVIAAGRETMDLSQDTSIRQVIAQAQPNLIINAAAYTAVDKAESEPELAASINALAPTVMAQEARALNATLIHVSTDYVFDGRKNTPYTEDDPTNPLGIYGRTKLDGEEGIRRTGACHLILRTAWVYGTQGKVNFVKTMLRLFAERDEVRVVADQVGSPTWAADLARAIYALAKAHADAISLSQSSQESEQVSLPLGTYHYTNSGVASWYDFAVAIFEEAKRLGFPLKVQRIVPITTVEYPTPAMRPAYSVLSGKKISAALGEIPPYWRHGLKKMLEELYSYGS
jgi:dTDP-4-dehydrorhamnose reductase